MKTQHGFKVKTHLALKSGEKTHVDRLLASSSIVLHRRDRVRHHCRQGVAQQREAQRTEAVAPDSDDGPSGGERRRGGVGLG